MKIHLVDIVHKYDEIYELIDSGHTDTDFDKLWEKIDNIIDNIIDDKRYSCIGYSYPEIIDIEEKRMVIHWVELIGTPSVAFIEILECPEGLLEWFNSVTKSHELHEF